MKPIERARIAVEEEKFEAALEALLEAWRADRTVEIADLIERVSPRAAEAAPKIDGKQLKEKQTQWLAIAGAGKASSLHELLPSVASVKTPQGVERLDALKHFAPDPRIGRALAKVFADLPFQGATTMPYWRKLFPLIVAHPDRRARDLLRSLVGTSLKRTGNAASISEFFERQLEKTLASLDGAVDRVSSVDDRRVLPMIEAALAAREKRAPATRDLTALFRAVYEAPDDDAPRLVLADALLEMGDPRGELITLQCEKELDEKQAKRVTALINKHGKTWIGALSHVATKQSLVFRRGFLAECVVFWKKLGDVEAAVGAPEWATVESVDSSDGGWIHGLVANEPNLRGVKKLGLVHLPDALPILDDERPRPLEELTVRGLTTHPITDDDRRILASPRGTPKLRRLCLHIGEQADAFRFVLEGPIARRLTTLSISTANVMQLLAALTNARPAPSCEVRLGVSLHPFAEISILRDASGAFSVFELEVPPSTFKWDRRHAHAASLLHRLGPNALTAFRVHGRANDDLAPLREALARQKRLVELVLPG